MTAASVQDRDADRPLLRYLWNAFPKVRRARADAGYAGTLVTRSKIALKVTLEIVKRVVRPRPLDRQLDNRPQPRLTPSLPTTWYGAAGLQTVRFDAWLRCVALGS